MLSNPSAVASVGSGGGATEVEGAACGGGSGGCEVVCVLEPEAVVVLACSAVALVVPEVVVVVTRRAVYQSFRGCLLV